MKPRLNYIGGVGHVVKITDTHVIAGNGNKIKIDDNKLVICEDAIMMMLVIMNIQRENIVLYYFNHNLEDMVLTALE